MNEQNVKLKKVKGTRSLFFIFKRSKAPQPDSIEHITDSIDFDQLTDWGIPQMDG